MDNSPAPLASALDSSDALPTSCTTPPIDLDLVNNPIATSDPVYSPTAIAASPFAVVTNNAPEFKYKYPEAKPTPSDEDDTVWNRTFTAADSRLYNKHGKNAANSKKFRLSGETRILALSVLAENKRKYFAGLAQGKDATPSSLSQNSTSDASLAFQASTSNTQSIDTTQMSISEKVKAEGGRNRKTVSVTSTPSQSVLPPTRPPALLSRTSMTSNALVKAEKETNKRLANGSGIKKPGPKPGPKQNSRQPKQEKSSPSSSNPNHPSKASGPSDSDSNDGGEYCICRGPDDHRMMVNCEGPCKDWYHCSCLGIDVEDAKELLDRYICPKCSNESLFTTYKPMCRLFNVSGCRKAAQIDLKPTPSMYCSEEHKRDFWMFIIQKLRTGTSSTIGGVLNQAEVASLAKLFKTRREWQALGMKPKIQVKNGADPNRPVGLDYITPQEAEKIEWIHSQKAILEEKIELIQAQKKLLFMIHEHSEIVTSDPKLELKDICGYDNRLSMNEAQFLRWRNSAEGMAAFETGQLGPRTEETVSIGTPMKFPGEVVPEPPTTTDTLHKLCLKPRKKCKHNGWRDIHGSDYQLSIINYEEHKTRLQAEENEIIEEAELREATKDYHAHNVTIQHF